MQTNITNDATSTTNATTSTTSSETTANATLADYLKARADEVRHAQEDLQRQQQREAEQKQEHYLSAWAEVVNTGVSAGLRRALELSEPQYIDRTDDRHGDYYCCVEATFTLDGETWTLRHWNGSVQLCGPNDYTMPVERQWTSKGWSYNRAILDAISAYPQWVIDWREHKAKRAAEEAEKARKAAETAQQPQRYTAIRGLGSNCLLRKGVAVIVSYPCYYDEDSTADYGTIVQLDDSWLLLDLNNGTQRLVNLRHVASIEPQEKQPQPAPQVEPDLNDEIPF